MRPFFRLFRLSLVALALFLLLGAGARQVLGQQRHSLAIQDGHVYIDGAQVPQDELPASLDVQNVTASLSFTGTGTPVLELNGLLYALEGKRLVEVGQGKRADGVQVYFRDEAAAARAPGAFAGVRQDADMLERANEAALYVLDPAEQGSAVTQRAKELQQYLVELEQLGAAMEGSEHVDDLVSQVRFKAEQAALAAQELPHIETQTYFQDIQRQDQELYERLVRERQRETETRRLAAEVRRLPEGEERAARIDALRSTLREIFELKQENRRREMQQLEGQLESLQERLRERERLRDRIIEERLKQLIGEAGTYDW
jgi:hypothetical protein